jgi:hypothetical protein
MTEPESSLGGEPPEAAVDAPLPPDPAVDPAPSDPSLDPEVEVVDGFPVLAEVRTVEPPAPASLPTVQVAAVAATGFVAGAATVALVRRRAARKVAARGGRNGSRRAAELLPIAATRSFLVDVHFIAKPE